MKVMIILCWRSIYLLHVFWPRLMVTIWGCSARLASPTVPLVVHHVRTFSSGKGRLFPTTFVFALQAVAKVASTAPNQVLGIFMVNSASTAGSCTAISLQKILSYIRRATSSWMNIFIRYWLKSFAGALRLRWGNLPIRRARPLAVI